MYILSAPADFTATDGRTNGKLLNFNFFLFFVFLKIAAAVDAEREGRWLTVNNDPDDAGREHLCANGNIAEVRVLDVP